MTSVRTLLPLVNAGSCSIGLRDPKEWLLWFSTLHRLSVNSSPPSSSPLFSSHLLDSRPFHPPASHLAWKTRPSPSHTLLICLTSLAMWLLNLFSCVRVVSDFLTLFGLSLLCLSLLSLCLLWYLRTLSLSLSGAVSGCQKGAATGHGDDGGGPYRSDSMKSMVAVGVKAGRWQTVQGHMQSGGLRPSKWVQIWAEKKKQARQSLFSRINHRLTSVFFHKFPPPNSSYD